jgi:hypothetical protein
MQVETLKNILIFLDRVQVVGKESVVWCMAYQEIQAEIAKLTAPKQPEPPAPPVPPAV